MKMYNFKYEAMDRNGFESNGEAKASSEEALITALREKNMWVTKIRNLDAKPKKKTPFWKRLFGC